MQQNLPPQHSIGFLIYEVSRLMRRDFDRRVSSLGLTQIQWRAIAHIVHNEGCHQAQLAEVLEIRPMTLSRLIDRLQAAGWVERRPHPEDRRALQVHLTAKAKPLIANMQKLALETRARGFAGIDEGEQAQLFRVLQRIKSNLAD